ncbi:MAG: L,D-transpeptidase [Halanaerobiaceae bacterium]
MRINCPWGVYGIHGTNKPRQIGFAEAGNNNHL